MTIQLEPLKIDPAFERNYTLAEFLELELAEDYDYELWRGRLVAKPKSGISAEHGKVVASLTEYLRSYSREHQLGTVFSAASTILGSTEANPTYVAPDVCFVAAERLPTQLKGPISVAPDLVVEVHSPTDSTEKIQEKIELYQAAGVRLIWSVWMLAKYIVVYKLNDPDVKLYNTYNGVLDGGEVLPGFSLAVKLVFE